MLANERDYDMRGTIGKKQRRPGWTTKVSAVVVALARSQRSLRRAARQSSDRQVSQRLRRLAHRRRRAAKDLAQHTPPAETDQGGSGDHPAPLYTDQIRTAGEIGSIAASIRANRKLAMTIEQALNADPPHRISEKLKHLRDQTEEDSARLNAQLSKLAAVTVAAGDTPPGGSLQ